MKLITRNDVSLAYEEINHLETNQNISSMLFVHGWSCDHTFLAPQANFFSNSHRIVSVDLRGHGKSDAPEQNYTMAAYADDLAWLSRELDLEKPVIVGHSMGGNVALELAARYPQLPSAIVMVDSVIFPAQEFRKTLPSVLEKLCCADYADGCQVALHQVCLPTDDVPGKPQLLSSLPKAPQHVLISAFRNHLIDYDPTPAATACCVPVAYIGAAIPLADLSQFRKLTPQLVTSQVLGSGHFLH